MGIQIGPLDLDVADQMWISRWLLYRISEEYGLVQLYIQACKGDWNGVGAYKF